MQQAARISDKRHFSIWGIWLSIIRRRKYLPIRMLSRQKTILRAGLVNAKTTLEKALIVIRAHAGMKVCLYFVIPRLDRESREYWMSD